MAENSTEWGRRMERNLRHLHEDARKTHRGLVDQTSRRVRLAAPRRTGELRRSIDVEHKPDHSTISYPEKYAALDHGGVIHPTHGAWLAVPVRRGLPASPRQDAGLFSIQLSDGRVVLAKRRGRMAEIRWRLVKSIRLRATGFASKTIARAEQDITDELAKRLVEQTR